MDELSAIETRPVVCVCVDDNYLPGALVALTSALRTTPVAFRPVVVDCGLSADSLGAVERSLPTAIVTEPVNALTLGDLATATLNDSLTPAMYGRFLAPFLVPQDVERLLYLDADMLVLTSLEPLLTMDLRHGIGAVLDTWVDPVHARELVGTDEAVAWGHLPYLNSGLLVSDVSRWRERAITERALAYLRTEPRMRTPDQDALNVILEGRWDRLDPSWNCYIQLPGKSPEPGTREQITRESDNLEPRILHFIGRRKPWTTRYLSDEMHAVYDSYLNDVLG